MRDKRKRASKKRISKKRASKKVVIEHTEFYPYLERYLEGVRIKGYSEDTIRRHEGQVRRFSHWAHTRGVESPKEVTKPVLERYQRHLYYYRKSNGEPLSFSSQKVAMLSLRAFFKWLTRKNYLLYNPASELELPSPPRKLPRTILSVKEVERILGEADVETVEGLRDRSMMELMYSTGIRRSEVCKLLIFDVHLERAILSIKSGKGGKDRMLPIGERALFWLKKYLEEVRERVFSPSDEKRLYLTDSGEPLTGGNLSHKVKKYMKMAGIEVHGSCHLFRHAMATHMLDNGADIRFIQAMLGHTDLSTTEIYTHVSVEKLREVHRVTHPAKFRRETPSS